MSRLLLACGLALAATAAHAQTVFINEVHYDNAGSDVGEAVEIAGPAGTDLTDWSVALYRGAGTVYGTLSLSGTIDNEGSGYGALSFSPSSLQNGTSGLALVDDGGAVVQFLSYEGTVTATEGPASGQTSTDIGVSESGSTAVGESLQLTGTGTTYEDFAWADPSDDSFGSVNSGQTFSGAAVPVVQFASTSATVDEDAGAVTLTVTISSAPDQATTVDVVFDADASGADAADVGGFTSETVTFPAGDGSDQTVTVTVTDDSDPEAAEDAVFDLANVNGDPDATLGSNVQFTLTINDDDTPIPTDIAVNEVDADTPGTDSAEFVELRSDGAGRSLDGLVLVFFDGVDDASYAAHDLDGQTTDSDGLFVLCTDAVTGCDLEVGGSIQNGADAVALYVGDASDFPNDTPASTTALVDAVVYGTNDGRDEDLLAALGEDVQFEDTADESLQAMNVPGATPAAGGLFYAIAPTPGAANPSTLTVDRTAEVNNTDGWRLLSAPVLETDEDPKEVDDLAPINLIQGVPASDGRPAQYPEADANLLTEYDGDGTFSAATGTGEGLRPGDGFFWYWYDQDITPDPSSFGGGTSRSYGLSNPDFTFALTGTPVDDVLEGGPQTITKDRNADGFYMLGNPYALPVALGGLSVSDGSLQDAFAVWNPSTGSYTNLTADFQDPFSGDVLPVWNGAFAEVSGATDASLTFTISSDNVAPGEGPDVIGRRAPEPQLALRLDGALDGDGTPDGGTPVADYSALVRVLPTAALGWDVHDASKLTPPTADYALVALVGERDGEARRQRVLSLPDGLDGAVEVPVAFRATGAGTFTLSFEGALPAGWSGTLTDGATGASTPVSAAYTFESDATDWTDRFALSLSTGATSGAAGPPAVAVGDVFPNPTAGGARLRLRAGGERVTATVYDAVGRAVAVLDEVLVAGETALDLPTAGLAPGVYVVRVAGETFVESRRLTVVR
jgi:hypothetical protein